MCDNHPSLVSLLVGRCPNRRSTAEAVLGERCKVGTTIVVVLLDRTTQDWTRLLPVLILWEKR